ncbi:MAG: BCCT family transporter [Desulfobacterales bacterium]|nr:BCCT family transporter [Desulfobacterales bacterium]
MNETGQKKLALRYGVMGFPLVIFGSILIMGFVNQKMFVDVLWGFFKWLMVNFGWGLSLGCLTFVLFAFVLMIHPIGKTKLGGKEATPEFSTWNWWAMSLCAGMAMGIVFWPAPEALKHSLAPAAGMFIEPGSHQAMLWAMRTSFLHWTFTPYAIYVVCGVLIAYAHYNLKKPLAVSSALYPLLGDRAMDRTATFVDGLTLFAITGGVAGSLGYGLLQLGSGMDFLFGLTPGPLMWSILCMIIVISYTTSSVTGLNSGIKWLSDKNAWLFVALLIFGFVFGPTAFSMNMTIQATGDFVNNFIEAMTFTSPFPGGDLWPQWWDMYWWADWLSFAPITGMFLARLSYGRTIRAFLFVNMVLPATFALIWFGVFGSLTIHTHFIEGIDLKALMDTKGYEVLMLRLFDFLPLASLIRPLMLFTIFISFVTLADSMTSTVSMLSLKGSGEYQGASQEPPVSLKLFWGILMGITSLVFMFNGGLEGIKVVKTIAGVPILILEICMLAGFTIFIFREGEKDASHHEASPEEGRIHA